MQHGSILFVSYWYPNKSNKNFGIFVKRHAQAIKEHHTPVVLAVSILKGNTLFKKYIKAFTDENGVETHQLYMESKFDKLLYVFLPLHYFILKKYVVKVLEPVHRFQFVHSNVIFPCGILGYRLSKKLGIPHILTEHWTRVDQFFNKNRYASLGKKVLDNAHAITCVSETLKATIQNYTSNRRFMIIPNVIDSAQFYYDPTIQKTGAFTFIAVASWMPHKNPFYFLNALQELANEKKIDNFKMIIVGKGGQIEDMKKAGYTFEIEYTGPLNAEEIRVLLNKSNVFLHGSDYETFSVIIAEALLCGLPSVVSPYGIATQVINPGNGFVTDNTHEDWKQKILACYHTTYDNRQIAEALKGAYDVKTVGKLFDKLYTSDVLFPI